MAEDNRYSGSATHTMGSFHSKSAFFYWQISTPPLTLSPSDFVVDGWCCEVINKSRSRWCKVSDGKKWKSNSFLITHRVWVSSKKHDLNPLRPIIHRKDGNENHEPWREISTYDPFGETQSTSPSVKDDLIISHKIIGWISTKKTIHKQNSETGYSKQHRFSSVRSPRPTDVSESSLRESYPGSAERGPANYIQRRTRMPLFGANFHSIPYFSLSGAF